jgi:hypothetical protein
MLSARKSWLVAVLVGLSLLGAASPARADLALQLTSAAGGNSGVITGANGFVNFSGPLSGDANFTVNVTTATAKGRLAYQVVRQRMP